MRHVGTFALGLLCGLFAMASVRQEHQPGLVLRVSCDPSQAEPVRTAYHLTEAPGSDWHDWATVSYRSHADAVRAAKAAVSGATLDKEQEADAVLTRHVRDPTLGEP